MKYFFNISHFYETNAPYLSGIKEKEEILKEVKNFFPSYWFGHNFVICPENQKFIIEYDINKGEWAVFKNCGPAHRPYWHFLGKSYKKVGNAINFVEKQFQRA